MAITLNLRTSYFIPALIRTYNHRLFQVSSYGIVPTNAHLIVASEVNQVL
jgi:hypothetical protein